MDRYEEIRKALAMGPTPGPWAVSCDTSPAIDVITQTEKHVVCMVRGITYFGPEQYSANGRFIAACDPGTIRALLDERDALAAEVERLREVLKDADNEGDISAAIPEVVGAPVADLSNEPVRRNYIRISMRNFI